MAGSDSPEKATTGIVPGFSQVDATGASNEFIEYLDAARKLGPIAQGKQWSFKQLRLTGGASALDVGCGTGDDVATMAQMVGRSGRAVGVDSSTAMISEAIRRHSHLPGVSFEVADAHELSFEAETFDACRAERTLQHVADPVRAVAEMARVLKPGGRIALIEPDWEGLVIEGADPSLSTAIWQNRMHGFRQPRIGRRLRTLLMQHGLADVTVEAVAVVNTDLDVVERNFEFGKAASEAASAGIVSEQDAQRWVDQLRNADREGYFLTSVLSFRVAGSKNP